MRTRCEWQTHARTHARRTSRKSTRRRQSESTTCARVYTLGAQLPTVRLTDSGTQALTTQGTPLAAHPPLPRSAPRKQPHCRLCRAWHFENTSSALQLRAGRLLPHDMHTTTRNTRMALSRARVPARAAARLLGPNLINNHIQARQVRGGRHDVYTTHGRIASRTHRVNVARAVQMRERHRSRSMSPRE